LRVFKKLPADEINTKIQDSFVRLTDDKKPDNPKKAKADLLAKTFRGWPSKPGRLNLKKAFDTEHKGVRFAAYDFDSQDKIRLRMYVAHRAGLKNASTIHVEVLGEEGWRKYLQLGRPAFAGVWGEELKLTGLNPDTPVTDKMRQALEQQLDHVRKQPEVIYITFMPRGVGLTALSDTNATSLKRAAASCCSAKRWRACRCGTCAAASKPRAHCRVATGRPLSCGVGEAWPAWSPLPRCTSHPLVS